MVFPKKFLLFCVLSSSLCVHAFAEYIYAPETARSSSGAFSRSYEHDSAGNRLTDGQGQVVKMGLSGFAEGVAQGEAALHFKYGLRGERYLQTKRLRNGNTDKKFYLHGGVFEYVLPGDGGSPQIAIYIKNGHYSSVAKVDVSRASNPAYEYYVLDHLGSALQAVNDAGKVVQGDGSRYDPWGQPVTSSGVTNPTVADGNRNFTGHEGFGTFGVVHMNGRTLDMHTGLVMQPDPLIKEPGHVPDYSRYVLTVNNPLSFVDPSGYMREPSDALPGGSNHSSDSEETIAGFSDHSSVGSFAGSSVAEEGVGRRVRFGGNTIHEIRTWETYNPKKFPKPTKRRLVNYSNTTRKQIAKHGLKTSAHEKRIMFDANQRALKATNTARSLYPEVEAVIGRFEALTFPTKQSPPVKDRWLTGGKTAAAPSSVENASLPRRPASAMTSQPSISPPAKPLRRPEHFGFP